MERGYDKLRKTKTNEKDEEIVNFCYCDESGVGEEVVSTMVGVLVDSKRMHITKSHWMELLKGLSGILGKQVTEIHTNKLYRGKGIWSETDGSDRAELLKQICEWLCNRKHDIVFTCLNKKLYFENRNLGKIPNELSTPWKFMGFHIVLALQKYSQVEPNNKGNTILVFDNQERARVSFPELICSPPSWSDEYYLRKKKKPALDQIVDVPYFADSQSVGLIQVADVISYFMRRYVEFCEGIEKESYTGEKAFFEEWLKKLSCRFINSSCIYPKKGRNDCHNLFFDHCPESIKEL